jgi:hypothetical protein
MKQRLDRLPFFPSALVAALIAAGVLSGCASATIEEAVPTAAAPAVPAEQASTPVETALSGGPKDTGTYPNLNIPRQAANQQLTPEQTTAEIEALKAAQAQQAAKEAGSSSTDPAVLRKLAETHADDALKSIEAQ